MESKKIKLSKIFNIVAILLGIVLLATLIGASIFAPVANIQAITKSEILNKYNIHFVTSKTDSSVTDGLIANEVTDKDDNTFTKYKYNRVTNDERTDGKVFYYGDYGATSYSDAYGSYILEEDNYSSLLLKQIEKYGSTEIVATNNGFIPTNTTHYVNVNNQYEEIFYDDTVENGFVFLDNYNVSSDTSNYENFYLAFGSPYSEDEAHNYVREFTVSGVLYNTSGEEHTLYLNTPQNDTINADDKKPITYWHQYFDLTNIQGDNGTTTPYDILNQEGKYEITIKDILYYDNQGNIASIGSYTYTFYLLDSANYSFPVISDTITEEDNTIPVTLANTPVEYYSQMGVNDSYISYDASRYKIDYTRLNYEYSENVTTTFTSSRYKYGNSNYEMGILSYIDSFKESGKQTIKESYILTHRVSNSKIEYMYLTNDNPTKVTLPKTTATGVQYEYNYTDIVNLINEDKLSFEYIRVEEMVDSKLDQYKTYIINDYPADINSPFDIDLTNNEDFTSKTIDTTNRNGIALTENLSNNKLNIDYIYNMPIDELGEYTFTYSYICPTYEDKNIYTTNTNITPVDFAKNSSYSSDGSTSVYAPSETIFTNSENGDNITDETTTTRLYLTVWGNLNEDNYVDLNGTRYTYRKSGNTEYINGFTFNEDLIWSKSSEAGYLVPAGSSVTATLTLGTSSNGSKRVIIKYDIGAYTTRTTTTRYYYNGNTSNSYYEEIVTTHIYSLKNNLNDVFKNNNDANAYEQINKIIGVITDLDPVGDVGDNYIFTTFKRVENKSTAGEEIVNSFGSIAYFNKDDDTTDSGYQRLEEFNKRKDFNFSADITSLASSYDDVVNTTTGLIATNKLTGENIVNTNAVPVLWRNYSNVDTSNSKIYHYPNAYIDANNLIVLGTASTPTTYTKDTYCGDNGLYIIEVIYTFATYPDDNKSFTQVFAFMVNNTSPTFDIEVEDEEDSTIYNTLDGKYTNRNVRISWNIPNVFQYNVYIEIEQKSYDGSTTLFKGEYYNENNDSLIYFTNKSADFTSVKDESGKHYVLLESTSNSNGKYFITIHYGKNGNSSTTKTFYIDNNPISNLNAYGVYEKTADGTSGYYVDVTSPLGQLTNTNFTFRYDEKASGAQINTYYYKINIAKNSNIGVNTITNNNRLAITNQYQILGNESTVSLAKYYNYNYEAGTEVNSNNCFINSESCLYLFKLEDLAGNKATFIVFFDKTNPSYIIEPALEDTALATRIINKTTKITWGDYKAISIVAPSDGINLTTPTTTLDIILSEIYLATSNSDSSDDDKFNKATYESNALGDYIFIPLTTKMMENTNSDNNIKSSTTLSDYYLFPVNPVSGGEIELVNGDKKQVLEGLTSGNPIKGKYATSDSDTTGTSLEGMVGSGVYVFTIGDKLDNTTSSLLWMNLDATQTFAYGLFGNESYISNSNILYNESPDTYALNELYISSLPATTESDDIPEYELTYTYYPINTSLYNNIESIEYVVDANDSDKTYLNITIKDKANPIAYLVTDEDGNKYPLNSYPYDLEGTTSTHVYGTNNSLANKFNDGSGRIYSQLINPTLNENQRKVTKEGFYVFRRIYTENVELPKNDSRIIYRSYYVDRNGIIDTTNSMKIGKDIGFTLGAEKGIDNTADDPTGYRVVYDYEDIYNSIDTIDTTSSNANHKTSNLFITNKMLLNYRITSDKYNYKDAFYNKTGSDTQISNLITNSDKTKALQVAKDTLFNNNYFSNIIYKLDFALYLGDMDNSGQKIIDETQITIFDKNVAEYFDGSYQVNNVISNDLYLHFGSDSSKYYTRLYDQAKKTVLDENGNIDNKASLNYANQLTMKFQIVHTPPEGDAYGKLYGNQHETNYDNDTTENGVNSLPMQTFDYSGVSVEEYALLYTYLDDLVLLSDGYKNTVQTGEGSITSLYSTNNKTLIFVFIEETQDNTKAKIDTNNISIWQGGENSTKDSACTDSNLIFKRTTANGVSSFIGNSRVSAKTMQSAYITNVINNIIYHAIIVFDDNLDEIYSETEKNNNNKPGELKYRLLDSDNNPDNAKYYFQIQYVGNEENYEGKVVNASTASYITINYFKSTYEVSIDRRKPNYNLTKLMQSDKYYNTNVSEVVTSSNHNTVFESYKSYYNITDDSENAYTSSELSKYFFAVDSRQNSSFAFESVSPLDNQGVIYFKKLSSAGATYDIANYKYSITPDNHEVYNGGTDYAVGHPRFSTTTATTLTTDTLSKIASGEKSIDTNIYYKLEFNTSINASITELLNDESLSTSNISIKKLIAKNIFIENNYYEIIECDEAGNYRVYGIYIPKPDVDNVAFEYEETSNDINAVTLKYNNSTANISGTRLTIKSYTTDDFYLKSIIKINSEYHKYTIYVTYQPLDQAIYINYTGTLGNTAINYTESVTDIAESNYKTKFVEIVNNIISSKSTEISNSGYAKYGHSIVTTFVNRIGLHTTLGTANLFNDFVINYVVAGNIIEPEFVSLSVPGQFQINIPGVGNGQTYITDLNVYKFNDSRWESIIQDSNGQTFTKTETQFKLGTSFRLSYGVWKFELTDNFNRTNSYFYEFLTGTTVAGGELKFQSKYITEDKAYITGNNVYYSFNHQSYSVYIKFYGNYYVTTEDGIETRENKDGIIIYTPDDIKTKDYSMFGIYGIVTNKDTTTITFSGVNGQPSARYEIKTIFAGTGNNYEWGQEELSTNTNKDLIVYNKDFTIYKAIQNPLIKNLNGSIVDLSSSDAVNLTEDVQIITKWGRSYTSTRDLKSYDSKIILTRVYTENGKKLTETLSVDSGYKIDKFGTYTAYVENSIGVTSDKIKFVRTKDTITQYAVYAVDNVNNSEEQVIESNFISSTTDPSTNDVISVFNYYVKQDYFSYLDVGNNKNIAYSKETDYSVFVNTFDSETPTINVKVNPESNFYIEIRVSSNLNLFSRLKRIAVGGTETDNIEEIFAEYEIYTLSTTQNNDGTTTTSQSTYRLLRVYFLQTKPVVQNNYEFLSFLESKVTTTDATGVNLAENSVHNIKSTEKTLLVNFDIKNSTGSIIGNAPIGDTLYIERYYNSTLVETVVIDWISNLTPSEAGNSSSPKIPKAVQFKISSVGLHTFKISDLAKRNHLFDTTNSSSTSLDIYLVNEVLYQVNDESPINNQIFNSDVKLQVLTEMNGERLYKNNISYSIFKNGVEIKPEIVNNTILFTEHGYYTVYMDATTELYQEGTIQTDKEVSTTYNFVIIKENIAMKSFGISNGKFILESMNKISEGYSTPLNYYNPSSLIWLTYEAPTEVNENGKDLDKIYGNAKYEITLKYYDENLKAYRPFTFKVWISGDTPNILSSVAAGTSTTDDITLTYNPGLIYTQRGKCYVKLNGEIVNTIDENSDIIPQTITISKKGEYLLEIYSADDETLILSSKYIKKEPFNAVTKVVLICVAIGVVVLAGVFFFIRRKGKYR